MSPLAAFILTFLLGVLVGCIIQATRDKSRIREAVMLADQYRASFGAACENVDDLQAELRKLRAEQRAAGERREILRILNDAPEAHVVPSQSGVPGGMEGTG